MAGLARRSGRTTLTGPTAAARAGQVLNGGVDRFIAAGLSIESAEHLGTAVGFAVLLLQHGLAAWDAPRPAPQLPSRGRGVAPLPKLPPVARDTAAAALELLRAAREAYAAAAAGADQVDADSVFDLAESAERAADLLAGDEQPPGQVAESSHG